MTRLKSKLFVVVEVLTSQYAHDVVLTFVRRRFNVMDVVWMSKRCRVLTWFGVIFLGNFLFRYIFSFT